MAGRYFKDDLLHGLRRGFFRKTDFVRGLHSGACRSGLRDPFCRIPPASQRKGTKDQRVKEMREEVISFSLILRPFDPLSLCVEIIEWPACGRARLSPTGRSLHRL